MSRNQWWDGYYQGLKKGIEIAREEYEGHLNQDDDYNDDDYGNAEEVIRGECDPDDEEIDEFFDDGDVRWDNDDCIDSKKKYRKLLNDWNEYWCIDDDNYDDDDDDDDDADDDEYDVGYDWN